MLSDEPRELAPPSLSEIGKMSPIRGTAQTTALRALVLTVEPKH
jgi:hypothetical protein